MNFFLNASNYMLVTCASKTSFRANKVEEKCYLQQTVVCQHSISKPPWALYHAPRGWHSTSVGIRTLELSTESMSKRKGNWTGSSSSSSTTTFVKALPTSSSRRREKERHSGISVQVIFFKVMMLLRKIEKVFKPVQKRNAPTHSHGHTPARARALLRSSKQNPA